MALGLNAVVLSRLWQLLALIQKGVKRADLKAQLEVNDRVFLADIGRLKKIGIPLYYKRSKDLYEIDWPSHSVSLRLESEQLFYFFYTLAILEKANPELSGLKNQLLSAVLPESSPIHDCGPAYGISQNINGLSNDLLLKLAEAIQTKHKIAFLYTKPNGEKELREVHPYKLLHSPISWYLAGYCADRKDWRIFKLARMQMPKVLGDTYQFRDFDLDALLGDAWWVQHDPERLSSPFEIKVLFKGDAAQSIKEYKFHKTQTYIETAAGTLVKWHLSYLNEFASWLMQWLGQIEIQSPQVLITMINKRLA